MFYFAKAMAENQTEKTIGYQEETSHSNGRKHKAYTAQQQGVRCRLFCFPRVGGVYDSTVLMLRGKIQMASRMEIPTE